MHNPSKVMNEMGIIMPQHADVVAGDTFQFPPVHHPGHPMRHHPGHHGAASAHYRAAAGMVVGQDVDDAHGRGKEELPEVGGGDWHPAWLPLKLSLQAEVRSPPQSRR